MPELGAGGGIGDLYQVHELELPDESTLAQLENLCLQQIPDKKRSSQMQKALLEAFQSRKKALSLDIYGIKEEGEMSLEKLVAMLGQGVSDQSSKQDLPNSIVSCTYPSGAHYSDHTSDFPIPDTPHIPSCASSWRLFAQKTYILVQWIHLLGTKTSPSVVFLVTYAQEATLHTTT